MANKEKINVQGTEIMLFSHKKEDYISLTDMAKYKNAEIPAHVISRQCRCYVANRSGAEHYQVG